MGTYITWGDFYGTAV